MTGCRRPSRRQVAPSTKNSAPGDGLEEARLRLVGLTILTYQGPKTRIIAAVETMHWSHNTAGRWRCAVLGATYQAYRVGDRKWMAGKIDPAGHYTPLGSYDTLKNCKMQAGLDYVHEKRQDGLNSVRS